MIIPYYCWVQPDWFIFPTIDVLTSASAIMLGLLFITSISENRKANFFLGLFLWSLAIEVFGILSEYISDMDVHIPSTSFFTIPLLFFYVTRTMNRPFLWVYILLFIPGVLVNLLPLEFGGWMGYVEYIFNIGILVYILFILGEHKKEVNNFYSDLENKTLRWIKIIVYIYLGFHAFWIVEDIIGFQNERIAEYFAALSAVFTLFMVYWIGHNGFSQHEMFKQGLFVTNNTSDDMGGGTTATATDQQEFDKIVERILKEKLFVDPKLNLRSLSKALQLGEKEVSRRINQQPGLNFYRFINRFRVDEFKTLLNSAKAKQLSTLGLAQEAGFNSKSTFYAAFKELEGMTPKQYEIRHKESE